MRTSEAVLAASMWADARSFFEAVGRAVDAVARIDGQLAYGVEGIERRPGGGPRPLTGDPTASAALFAESARMAMERLEARRAELARLVEAGRAVVSGVRLALPECADALATRYLGRMTWEDAAEACGCSRSTAIRRAAEAFEWIDSVGWRRAVEGRGIAEG